MKPIFVESSNIDCLGYEDRSLFIRFNSGITYKYQGVPHNYIDQMKVADSVGQFFHRYIRNNKTYHYQKLDVDPFEVPFVNRHAESVE